MIWQCRPSTEWKWRWASEKLEKCDDQNREVRKAKYESYRHVHNSKIQLETCQNIRNDTGWFRNPRNGLNRCWVCKNTEKEVLEIWRDFPSFCHQRWPPHDEKCMNNYKREGNKYQGERKYSNLKNGDMKNKARKIFLFLSSCHTDTQNSRSRINKTNSSQWSNLFE